MAEAEFDRAVARLKEHQVRLTPQRKTILDYLITHHTHPTVEMILADLQKRDDSISMATVYNTVKLLINYHLVIEIENGDGSIHYDYFGHPHYHVICDNCGKITDVMDERFADIAKELAQVTRDNTNYLVTRSDVEVHGICPECQVKLGLVNNRSQTND